MARIRGKEIRGYIYEQKFDQRYVHHFLEILHSIVQFGGQGFTKTARSAPIKRIQYEPLVQRVEAGNYSLASLFLVYSTFVQHSSTRMPVFWTY